MLSFKDVSKDEAKRILSDAWGDGFFWLKDGNVLKNLHELKNCLEHIPNEVFQHHVNKEKNDFFNWVEGVFKDKKLSSALKKAKTKATMHKALVTRIQKLEKIANS
jgi:hypothetical protein